MISRAVILVGKKASSYCQVLVVTSHSLKFGLCHHCDPTEVFLQSVFSGCVLGSFWKLNFQFNEHFNSCGAHGDVCLSALKFPKLVGPLPPRSLWDVIYSLCKALPPVLFLVGWCAQRKILKKQWFEFSFPPPVVWLGLNLFYGISSCEKQWVPQPA